MRWAIDELLGTRCGKGLPAAVLIWGLLARVTLGQSGAEDVDVAFTFIDRAAEATEHFNEGRAAEALAIFQGLLEKYPDQDADGYVSLSIGDCLFALDRFDEAVAAYQRTVNQHPELARAVADRLAEVQLARPVTDALLDELRRRAESGSDRGQARWRLGRALQKRAAELLEEAMVTFKAAAQENAASLRVQLLSAHVTYLQELGIDLTQLIQQFESICALNLPDRFLINRLASRADKSPRIVAERAQAEQVLRTSDGQRYQVQVRVDAPGSDGQVIINGRPVPLTDAQRKLIQRHYDRINQIYLEAYLDAARQ